MLWGERKELFGKNAVTIKEDKKAGNGGYSVVYEFGENGSLKDARLVKGEETVYGRHVDEQTFKKLSDALAQDKINLHNVQDTQLSTVFNAASFADGRVLIQLLNKNELYLGTAGNFKKLDATLQVQGGNSMYYKTAAGDNIALPYSYGGPGPNDVPSFNDEELEYLPIQSGSDPKALGLEIPEGTKVLDPFSPEVLAKAKPLSKPSPPRFRI
jgi:hypothetical protein